MMYRKLSSCILHSLQAQENWDDNVFQMTLLCFNAFPPEQINQQSLPGKLRLALHAPSLGLACSVTSLTMTDFIVVIVVIGG